MKAQFERQGFVKVSVSNIFLSVVIASVVALSAGAASAQTGTPVAGGGSCEVEPLTVDQVMEIVKHPGYFMVDGPSAPRAEKPLIGYSPTPELVETPLNLQTLENQGAPDDIQFQSASDVADRYLNCIVFGTQGQVWSLLSPSHIQATILADFPVYADETEVRTRVEERIVAPAYEGEALWESLPFLSEIDGISVNPDARLAILQGSGSPYFDQVVRVGVKAVGADGETIALTNGLGRDLVPGDPLYTRYHDGQLFVTLVKYHQSDIWVVVPFPSAAELGF